MTPAAHKQVERDKYLEKTYCGIKGTVDLLSERTPFKFFVHLHGSGQQHRPMFLATMVDYKTAKKMFAVGKAIVL